MTYHHADQRQAGLERQDLSCTYLAHHELESVMIIIIIIRPEFGDAHLETGEAQEEAGTHPNLIHKVPVASFNSLAYIAHDMHAQDLHCPQLNISWKLLEVGKVLNRLQLLAWGPLYMHAHTDMSIH